MFTQTELLDERVTISWLVNLGATVVSLLLIAFALGRKRHLSAYRWLYMASPTRCPSFSASPNRSCGSSGASATPA